MARSACASSPPRKSSCRSSDVTDARSSSGSGSVSSHARPVFPNRSDTGGRGIRLRCSTACTRFLILVRCFTRCDRAVVIRRNIAVRSSGNQTGGKKSTASSCARILASTLSVLIFASAIARVFNGFDTTTRPAYCDNRPAIASLLPVASNATWSSTVKSRSPRSKRLGPAIHPSHIDNLVSFDDRDLREIAMHVHTDESRHHRAPSTRSQRRERAEQPTLTDSRSRRSRTSRKGGHLLHGLSAHHAERPAHTDFPRTPLFRTVSP